ncbi:MAG: HD domain-containing phosphohydrolase [Fervidobacterium sp.]|uniref:Putative two-component system response regulator n=1 Tax=Fervidobacterium gondwanense DSM 13020 TaxID=1121883 RepID=A0A1M7SHW4_FERGO|nr:HD domain-containing phosphohydrolase [Fervidobacterium gondwanense]SHN58017.1 putative two-component system response regulator [Fervidobacterium gondwanense DSM 13020]
MDDEKKSTVLVIDDDALVRNYISSVLKKFHIAVETAENGEEGYNIFKASPESHKIVIVDLMMSVMGGLEFIEKVRKNYMPPYPYIIVLTSKGEEDIVAECLDLGANDFLTKPITPKLLVTYVRKAFKTISMIDPNLLLEIPTKLMESKDLYTVLHSENVRLYSSVLSKLLLQETDYVDIDEAYRNSLYDFTYEIEVGALLHDTGKIAIPDLIWMKPGRYSPEERKIMETHTTKGALAMTNLINRYPTSTIIKTCYEIVRWHHERWDGKGYPDGLKGKEIPISARIVAIADVFDALTTRRIYRNEYSPEQALEIMINEEDGHFDPEIFKIFLQHDKLFTALAKSRMTAQILEIQKLSKL